MRKFHKNNYFSIFIILILNIGIGYSYLNSSLFINGTSTINANIWSVGLTNLNVIDGSVSAIIEPVIDNKITSTNFEIKLENQDDFYEFIVDVANNGDHDARLKSLVEITGLTTEQEHFFNYTVSYQNNKSIQVNQLVKKDEYVRLKIRVKYNDGIDITQVPDSLKTLNLGFKLNYDLDDGNGVAVENNGIKLVTPVADGKLDKIGTIVTIDSEQFYTIGTEGDNVKLLSMYNLYAGGVYRGGWKAYGSEATGKQDSNMTGWKATGQPFNGTTPFSETNYWVSTATSSQLYVYNKDSTLYSYVEKYKEYLNTLGVSLIEARLISLNELIDLGCTESSCIGAPVWIYSSSYWTGMAGSANGSGVASVKSNGNIYNYNCEGKDHSGCRPVIVIPKSEIIVEENESIEFITDNTTYQTEEENITESISPSDEKSDFEIFPESIQ